MKSAHELLDELLRHVLPPQGCAIVLVEEISKAAGEPNWTSSIGVVPTGALSRYQEKFLELRRSDPHVDWSNVAEQTGERKRIGKYLSEVAR